MLLIFFLDSEVLQAPGIKITATKTKPQVNPDDRICKNVLPLIEQFFPLSFSVSQPQNLQLNNASQRGHSCQCSFEILNSSSRAPGSGLPPPDLVKMKANVREMTEVAVQSGFLPSFIWEAYLHALCLSFDQDVGQRNI